MASEALKLVQASLMPALYDHDELFSYIEDYMGWCTFCRDFTRDCTEPDAEGYDCPECDQNTVMGAENAILEGRVGFLAEREDNV